MHTATQFPLIMIFHHLLPPTPDPWQNMKTAPNLKLCHIALFIFLLNSVHLHGNHRRKGKTCLCQWLWCAENQNVLRMNCLQALSSTIGKGRADSGLWDLSDPKILLLYILYIWNLSWTPAGKHQMTRSRKRKKVLGWVQRLETANVQGFHPFFHENDLAPHFHPLSALSLKETTLSGC